MKKKQNADFYVRFLGGFFLEFKGKRIIITKNLKQKSMQMLLLLLKAGREGEPRRQLVEMLEMGGKNWERKRDNLRHQAYKLRQAMAESGFPDGDYIQVSRGRYYFSFEYTVETDIKRLDQLYQEAKNQAEEGKREEILRVMCSLYQGEFLPSLMAEEWALVENAHYRRIYFWCMKELCRLLEKRGDYTEISILCARARQMYPYDDWQAFGTGSLAGEKQNPDGLSVYRTARKALAKEQRVMPFWNKIDRTYGLEKLYAKANEVMQGVMGELDEDTRDGAYRCGYPNFVDVCRLMGRMSEQGLVKLNLLLCTLTPRERAALECLEEKEGKEDKDSRKEKEIQLLPGQAERFEKLLAGLIRESDVYTRYSRNQYLVLLVNFGGQAKPTVVWRMRQGWDAFEKEENIEVKLEMQAWDGPGRKEAI